MVCESGLGYYYNFLSSLVGSNLVPMVAVFNGKESSDKHVITFPTLHPMYHTAAVTTSPGGKDVMNSTASKLKIPKRQNSAGSGGSAGPRRSSPKLLSPKTETLPSSSSSSSSAALTGTGANPNLTLNWSQLVHLKSSQQWFIQQWAEQEKKNKEMEKPVAEQLCEICEDRATGLHYGIVTCEG